MKWICLHLSVLMILSSCDSNPGKPGNTPVKPAADTVNKTRKEPRFFPVTDYLEGQLFDLGQRGITPLKYITIKGRTDSTWLKPNEIRVAVREFLEPRIDSVNLVSFFTEKKFMDQTLDAVTFTYEPTGKLPDSMKLEQWTVYINPETGKVKRIYMVKQGPGNTTLQLTWLSDKWCKITTFSGDAAGSQVVEREEKINWDF